MRGRRKRGDRQKKCEIREVEREKEEKGRNIREGEKTRDIREGETKEK